jgi:FKBP-type peptidyl-prolyl cis-trans isomerase
MKEGARYKMIIPWPLAYGERGMGPILPCTSLIFDVELVKVN